MRYHSLLVSAPVADSPSVFHAEHAAAQEPRLPSLVQRLCDSLKTLAHACWRGAGVWRR